MCVSVWGDFRTEERRLGRIEEEKGFFQGGIKVALRETPASSIFVAPRFKVVGFG